MDTSELAGLQMTREEIEELLIKNPNGFYALYKKVHFTQAQLASVDINYFIQYVMKEEGNNKYLRQTPLHVALQKFVDEHQMTLIWGAVGLGKCTVGRTRVVLESGEQIPVIELYERHKKGERLKIWTFDHTTWRRKLVGVKAVFENGIKPITTITLSSGHRIATTENHPFLTSTVDGPEFLEARELSVGDDAVVIQPPMDGIRGDNSVSPEEAFLVGLVRSCLERQSNTRVSRYGVLGHEDAITITMTTTTYRAAFDAIQEMIESSELRSKMTGSWYEPSRGSYKATFTGVNKWLEPYGLRVVHEKKDGVRYAKIEGGMPQAFMKSGAKTLIAYMAGLLAPWVHDHPHMNVGHIQVTHRIADQVVRASWAAGVECRRLSWKYFVRRRKTKELTFRHKRGLDHLYFETLSFMRVIGAMIEHFKTPAYFEQAFMQLSDDRATCISRETYLSANDSTKKRIVRALSAQLAEGTRGARLSTARVLAMSWMPKMTDTATYVPIASIKRPNALHQTMTYGIEVDDELHTHITDGILTHNTQQITVARTLFSLGKNPNMRVLIVQSTGDLAKDALHQIKTMIEESPRLHEVFPNLKPGDRWAEKEIRVQRTTISLTPSVRAIGSNTKIDGSRYDLVLVDDALSFENTLTKNERDKLFKWLTMVPLSRIEDWTKVVIIGNAWHCMLPQQLVLTDYGLVQTSLLNPTMKVQVGREEWEQIGDTRYHMKPVEKMHAVKIAVEGLPWSINVTANHKLMDQHGKEVYAGNVKEGDLLAMWRESTCDVPDYIDKSIDNPHLVIPDHVALRVHQLYAELGIFIEVRKTPGGCLLKSSNMPVQINKGRLLHVVKSVEHFEYTGNVYDITTSTGWFMTASATIHNSDDPMHRFEKMEGWHAKRFPARDPVTKKTLLPYRWPQDRIERWEKTRPPSEVRRTLDCVPWSNESSRFKLEWFDDALKKGRDILVEDGEPVFFLTSYDIEAQQKRVEKMRDDGLMVPMPVGVFTGVDIGFGLSESADFTVLVTIVVHDDGSVLLIDLDKGRYGTAEFIDKVVSKHTDYGSDVFVESVLAQQFMFNIIKEQYPGLPLFEWRTQGTGTIGNKWHAIFGIASLEEDFARSRWVLPCVVVPTIKDGTDYEVHPFVREFIDDCLTYVPDKTVHTSDIIMATWICLQGARLRGSHEYLAALVDVGNPYAEHSQYKREDGTDMTEDERMADRLWSDVRGMIDNAPWGLDEEIDVD